MKRKLVIASLLMAALFWILTGVDLLRIGIAFVAAGAIPGLQTAVSPYLMVALAICAASVGGYYIFTLDGSRHQAHTSHTPLIPLGKQRRRFMRLET